MKYLILSFVYCFLFALPNPANSEVVSKEYPKRIVSLGPINTENLYLLNAQDRLVGNTRYCVRPEDARSKEKVGSVVQINIEKIISLRPDLILATRFTQQDQVKQLKSLGLQVVKFKQSASFRDSLSQFIQLGKMLGLEDTAKQITHQANSEVETVKMKVAHLVKQKVFLQVGARPLSGSVKNSFTNDYITLGGGINILADQKSNKTSYEKVIAKNPDVIIIAIMGTENGIAAKEKKHWQRFHTIKAVQEDRVYVINPDLVCSPSPATFAQTLQIIAGLIHPEILKENE